MSTASASALFRSNVPSRWRSVLDDYPRALRQLEEKKTRRTKTVSQPKDDNNSLFALDRWYQRQLPSLLRDRQPPHMRKEELVRLMDWKLKRGKFRPRLAKLIASNAEAEVEAVTTRAFSLLQAADSESDDVDDATAIEQAMKELCILHGVGPATASAILAAFDDDSLPANFAEDDNSSSDKEDTSQGSAEHPMVAKGRVPFMADEVMEAVPGLPAGRYTAPTYRELIRQLTEKADELNAAVEKAGFSTKQQQQRWSARQVELALWAAAHND